MCPDATTGGGSGRRVGRYELVRRLAIGGMGEVFLAREQGVAAMGRLVVIKQLIAELAEDPRHVALFVDEARIAAQLVHPNIVQTYEFGNDGGVYYLAMEYVPGPSLSRLYARALQHARALPAAVGVHAVAEMSRGLEFAHTARDSRGTPLEIVHRDVSPHNVLVSYHGDVKLMDFGIATSRIRRQRTQTGALRGKLAYMSPEQIAQELIDHRSDIFSAGVVLWETTLMRRLFSADTEVGTIQRVTACEVPAPRTIDPSYPADLEAVVMTALSRDPAARFQSAGALHAALRAVLAGQAPLEAHQLGALVLELFPELTRPEAETERRNTLPVGRVMAPAARPPTAPPAPEPAVAAPRARRWPLAIAGLVVAGAALAFVATRTGDTPVADAADAGLLAAPAADAGALAAASADAGAPDAAVAIAARPRDPDRRAEPRRRRPDAGLVAVPDPRAPEPVPTPPPVAPPDGELAVASSPHGRVGIDGTDYGYTDLQRPLAPGTYRISIKPTDGSGVFAATARVESRKKTKCVYANQALTCRSPR